MAFDFLRTHARITAARQKVSSGHSFSAFRGSSPFAQIRRLRRRTEKRMSFERRLFLWLILLAVPLVSTITASTFLYTRRFSITVAAGLATCFFWALSCSVFFDQIVRPLQTLTNVVAALSEDDFSFRARGARRGDSLGDLALELNNLAGTLQKQRSTSIEALALVERVLSSMPSPVLAFDGDGKLRLFNRAAERAFGLSRPSALGRAAAELGLSSLVNVRDQQLYVSEGPVPAAPDQPAPAHSMQADMRWSVRRSTFRLYGVSHSLIVLSDISLALREEERSAWQRLIRVLGHEINNSLTPIKSIAGSLRSALRPQDFRSTDNTAASLEIDSSRSIAFEDFNRGLAVIEDRAASLNRFLQAYQRLTRLPPPRFVVLNLSGVLTTVAALETRLNVTLHTLGDAEVLGDSDQLEQLFINLVQNATDSALSDDASSHNEEPRVSIGFASEDGEIIAFVQDNGPGLSNPENLFVPFYTTKASGTGIGLVLAQAIAAAHNSNLSLYNLPQGGCRAELRMKSFSATETRSH